jgi:tripartite-type tricarboxylate transporter receptor subunit TctC
METTRITRRSGLALVALLALAGPAAAQSYPTKPLRVINPWTPGGPAEIVARPIMHKLSEALGQPVVIESRAGANGVIGSAIVARAPPDGYTLLFSHVGPIAISPAMQADMPYDSVKDFQPVTQFVSGPTVLVVRPDIPVKSVKELVEYAKANPGKVTYGSVGPGSTTHLAGEMLKMMTGADFVHVPYKGAAPVVNDLLGGQIAMAFINVSGALPQIEAGKLRPIAVSTLKRSAVLPELPTVAETLPGFEVNSWYGFMAPAGTPREIVDRLYSELAKIVKSPEITERLKQAGLDPEATTPEQHAAKIKDDIARWATLVKATGAKIE